ncbi:MAG: hypothetical protein GX769_01395 [Erysipelothrix sp.]|nr:hypothetical protein [Erysipelothrix sp.]
MRDILRKTGVVSKVYFDHEDVSVGVRLENNQEEILIINELTRVYDNEKFEAIEITEIEVGHNVNIYYRENTPMMMSLPPKYVPELLIVDTNDDYIEHKFSYFDEDLVSADNQIQISDGFLRLVESLEYRPLIKELLVNEELLVFYKRATKSIPAQVYPIKVIIL